MVGSKIYIEGYIHIQLWLAYLVWITTIPSLPTCMVFLNNNISRPAAVLNDILSTAMLVQLVSVSQITLFSFFIGARHAKHAIVHKNYYVASCKHSLHVVCNEYFHIFS